MKLPKPRQKDNGKWIIQVQIDKKRVISRTLRYALEARSEKPVVRCIGNSEITYIFEFFLHFLVKITKTSLQMTKNLLEYK